MHAYSILQILDCRESPWLERVAEAADSRRNFIPILKSDTDLDPLCDLLGCSPRIPERLYRWGIHALAEVLEPQGYSMLLGLYEKYPVYLVEQLRLQQIRKIVWNPLLHPVLVQMPRSKIGTCK